jgi:ribonuclease HII
MKSKFEFADLSPLWTFDEDVRNKSGKPFLCGVDEVGRGSLAGPIAAGAVILDASAANLPIKDSKKMSKSARERIYPVILEHAIAWTVKFIPPEEIDEFGIGEANATVMRMAIMEACKDHDAVALVDGEPQWFGKVHNKVPTVFSVRGDDASLAVAAASILAKVTRDRLMAEMELDYPGYGFAKHAGYGTPEHIAALKEIGPSKVHRISFLGKILPDEKQEESRGSHQDLGAGSQA